MALSRGRPLACDGFNEFRLPNESASGLLRNSFVKMLKLLEFSGDVDDVVDGNVLMPSILETSARTIKRKDNITKNKSPSHFKYQNHQFYRKATKKIDFNDYKTKGNCNFVCKCAEYQMEMFAYLSQYHLYAHWISIQTHLPLTNTRLHTTIRMIAHWFIVFFNFEFMLWIGQFFFSLDLMRMISKTNNVCFYFKQMIQALCVFCSANFVFIAFAMINWSRGWQFNHNNNRIVNNRLDGLALSFGQFSESQIVRIFAPCLQ